MASWSAHRIEAEEDWERVWLAVQWMIQTARSRGRKPVHKIADELTTFNALMAMEDVWLVDGYLVAFRVATPWYSQKKVLFELLVVRVDEGGTLTSVAQFLRQKAQEAGAEFAAVGTTFALSDRALARCYQAEGFTPDATQLTSET